MKVRSPLVDTLLEMSSDILLIGLAIIWAKTPGGNSYAVFSDIVLILGRANYVWARAKLLKCLAEQYDPINL